MKIIDFLKKYYTEEDTFIFVSLHRKGEELHNRKIFTKTMTLKDKGLMDYINRLKWFNSIGYDIYFSLNSLKNDNGKANRKATGIDKVKSFYFDIDENTEIIYPKIIEYFGTPTFDVNTSPNKKQLIYQFKEAYSEDITYFSRLLEGATNNFCGDKTFDVSRIFRLSGDNTINNKNGHVVNYEYTEIYYDFEDFEKLSLPFLHLSKKENKTPSKKSKKVSNKKVIEKPNKDFTKYDKYKGVYKINKKYNDLLEKCNYDYSKTDISFVKWLRTSKQISNEEILIEKLFFARSYDSLMDKHSYQIDYYLENILEKTL